MKKISHPGFELWTPASILSLDHQNRYRRIPHINISSIQNYQGLILAGHFYWFGRFVPSNGIFTSTTVCIWLWWFNVKILTTVAGVLGSNPGCEF
jgi:hypothetical protein